MNPFVKTLPLLLLTATLLSCSTAPNPLHRLQGTWVQPNRSEPFVEIWSVTDEGILTGKGGQIKNGDTSYHENLLINHSAMPSFYRALLPGREAVDFLLDRSTENGWTWRCATNDFPRSISYEFIGPDFMQVILSGDAPTITLLLQRQNEKP